jgi:7,8-dihydropterin-6-yl-methyl-4-(beta-D-ribofuranosyl)aminobenzene 5'-phosphate synthase
MCVVDNTAQRGSPFWGEHGLAFWIETEHGKVLFDTGNTGSVLWHNLGLLGRDVRETAALVLSHAHNDHTGGVAAVLSAKPGLPLYANPDLFRPRFSRRDGRLKPIGLKATRAELSEQADVRLAAAPTEVLPGVWTTGEIAERTEPEGRGAGHFVPAGDGLQPDPYRDDLSMVVETPKGLVVMCGCCHAGLLNTMTHVRRVFGRQIVMVTGGTHLESADDAHLQHVVTVLRDTYGAPHLYLNHCTGERAYVALASAFDDRVKPCPAGTVVTLD